MGCRQFIHFITPAYKKDPIDKHKLVIDESAASIVREIFALYIEGHGTSGVAAILTRRGILTPTMHKKQAGLRYYNPGGFYSQAHGVWSDKTISRILRNKAYIGTLVQGMERRASYKSKRCVALPKDEWVMIPNNHTPIVTNDMFNQVQRIIGGKRRHIGKQASTKPHLLSGKLICAECGSTMQRSGVSRDGSSHYIRCMLAAKTRKKDCTPHSTRQDVVEAIIKHQVAKLARQALNSDTITKNAIARINGANNPHDNINTLASKISQLERNIAMAYSDKLNGFISESDFINYKKIFEEEKQTYAKQKDYLAADKKSFDIEKKIAEYKNLDALTHEIVNYFIDTIVIGEKSADKTEQSIRILWKTGHC